MQMPSTAEKGSSTFECVTHWMALFATIVVPLMIFRTFPANEGGPSVAELSVQHAKVDTSVKFEKLTNIVRNSMRGFDMPTGWQDPFPEDFNKHKFREILRWCKVPTVDLLKDPFVAKLTRCDKEIYEVSFKLMQFKPSDVNLSHEQPSIEDKLLHGVSVSKDCTGHKRVAESFARKLNKVITTIGEAGYLGGSTTLVNNFKLAEDESIVYRSGFEYTGERDLDILVNHFQICSYANKNFNTAQQERRGMAYSFMLWGQVGLATIALGGGGLLLYGGVGLVGLASCVPLVACLTLPWSLYMLKDMMPSMAQVNGAIRWPLTLFGGLWVFGKAVNLIVSANNKKK